MSGGDGSYVRRSQAKTALLLVIVGMFCCGVPSIVGTVMARADLSAMRRGRTDPADHGLAQGAFIVGLIASTLWLAMVALWLVLALASTMNP